MVLVGWYGWEWMKWIKIDKSRWNGWSCDRSQRIWNFQRSERKQLFICCDIFYKGPLLLKPMGEHWCIRRNFILIKVRGPTHNSLTGSPTIPYKMYPELHVTIIYLTVVEDLSGWPQHFPGNPSPLSAHLQPAFSQMRKVFYNSTGSITTLPALVNEKESAILTLMLKTKLNRRF